MGKIVDENLGKPSKETLPRAIGEQPGGLRSETRMTIQTRQAQKLVLGRKRTKDIQPIIGLLDFGRRMKLLWLSAQANDPYADWSLLRIEESIEASRQQMKDKKIWLDDVLNAMQGFEIKTALSLDPIQVPITFQNPYGYMGAYLIADYDSLCCSVFTASHIGLIDRAMANKIIGSSGKLIRRTFDMAAKWKFTGATREDIETGSLVGLKAIELYGECPEPVLSGTKRAKISPEIREKKKPVVTVKKPLNVEKIKPGVTEIKEEPEQKETVTEGLFGMV